MEIDKKINQRNAAGIDHGYYESSRHIGERVYYRFHFFNGELEGYAEGLNSNNDITLKCYFKNNTPIGCRFDNYEQYYYNKSGNKFGEELTWK